MRCCVNTFVSEQMCKLTRLVITMTDLSLSLSLFARSPIYSNLGLLGGMEHSERGIASRQRSSALLNCAYISLGERDVSIKCVGDAAATAAAAVSLTYSQV